MERELEDLAARGARTLVAGLHRSGEAALVREAFATWFERAGWAAESDLLRGPTGRLSYSLTRWRGVFLDVLANSPGNDVAGRLATLIGRFSEPAEARRPAGRAATAANVGDGILKRDKVVPPPAEKPGVPGEPADRPGVAGDHVDFRRGTFHGPVVGTQHTYVNHPGAVLPDPGRWPTPDEIDPVALGVRPTRRPGHADLARLPAYVERDIDAGLHGWHERDDLLVVTGGPLSGKSRTAWSAGAHAAGHSGRVFAPAPGTDLRGLPETLHGRAGRHVLWLDQLEDHLGEHGLNLGLLGRLAVLRVPVVATMRDEVYEEHRFGDGPASKLLARARVARVGSRWSGRELARLAGHRDDDRLADALEWSDEGVTQFLALGPELYDLWHSSGWSDSRHPYGHLLVRAAVDLARCGVTGGVPRALLEGACRYYSARRPRSESFQDAVAWAATGRHGAAGLLVRVPGRDAGTEGEETWRAHGSLVADAMRRSALSSLPTGVWLHALEGTAYDADVQRTVRETAHAVFAPRAEAGDPEAMHLMGVLGRVTKDEATELKWFRRAADAGRTDLAAQVGELLLGQGKAEEALPYLRAAVADHPRADVADLLGRAHLALAEHWLRTAAEGGHGEAERRLRDLTGGHALSDLRMRLPFRSGSADIGRDGER
ncbi:tetratricopeptide repeat protein [Streptomyces adustus]|uniref:tetratricopeptide repeat protein n=1 Tax=Streptomyces adustus TaxID=1609272 RepID=UPI003717A971